MPKSTNQLETYIQLNVPFKSETYKGVVGVILLHSIIAQDLEKHLKQFGVTYQQFNILRILKGQHPTPTRLSLLKERMINKQSDVSRLVDRLYAQKLVHKKNSINNKRVLHIELSDKGLQLVNSIDITDPGFMSILDRLSEKELVSFNNIIGKLVQTL